MFLLCHVQGQSGDDGISMGKQTKPTEDDEFSQVTNEPSPIAS